MNLGTAFFFMPKICTGTINTKVLLHTKWFYISLGFTH